MSDAKVRFVKLGQEAADPGQEQMFSFNCPQQNKRCTGLVIAGKTPLKRDPQGRNDGVPQWDWDHNRSAPSFAPSINCGVCAWHGYIRRGRCVDVQNNDEPEIARPGGFY